MGSLVSIFEVFYIRTKKLFSFLVFDGYLNRVSPWCETTNVTISTTLEKIVKSNYSQYICDLFPYKYTMQEGIFTSIFRKTRHYFIFYTTTWTVQHNPVEQPHRHQNADRLKERIEQPILIYTRLFGIQM